MIALQLLFNGLIAGSLYALVAAGFSLIYAVNRFVHFAHGAMVTVSAYLLFAFYARAGLPFPVACVLTIVAAALLGYVSHRLLFQPLRTRGASNAVLLVASIGWMILLENCMLLFFGPDVKTIDVLAVRPGWNIAGAIITPLQIVIIASTVVLLVLLWFVMQRTHWGVILRAVADNPELAKVSGYNAHTVQRWSFVIGSGMAGVAAIFIALEQNIDPVMGSALIIKGFTGAVMGGITSVPGAVLGSYLLGITENVGIWWLPSGWKDAIAFALLFLFLLFRPAGILGRRASVRDSK